MKSVSRQKEAKFSTLASKILLSPSINDDASLVSLSIFVSILLRC